MRRKWLALLLLAACDGPIVGERAAALSAQVELSDPGGDVAKQVPEWLDLVGGAIRLDDGVYTFTWKLAASVPEPIVLSPNGTKFSVWVFHLDTDPSTAPAGLPVNQNQALAAELVVVVTGDESGLSAALYDRRPLLEGQTWAVTPLPLLVNGPELQVTVASSLLGDPSTFAYAEVTANWTSSYGADGAHVVDAVGDWPTFP